MRYRQSSDHCVDIIVGNACITFKTFLYKSLPKCHIDITDFNVINDLKGYKESCGSLGMFLYKQGINFTFIVEM